MKIEIKEIKYSSPLLGVFLQAKIKYNSELTPFLSFSLWIACL